MIEESMSESYTINSIDNIKNNDRVCKIYAIINNINGLLYVGQTWNTLKRRFSQHTQKDGCPKLYRALKKYGKENFKIFSLQECFTQEEADNVEKYYIELLDCIDNGYNLMLGGFGGKHSDESKKKMSESRRGKVVKRKISEEEKLKISETRLLNNGMTREKADQIRDLKYSKFSTLEKLKIFNITKNQYHLIMHKKNWTAKDSSNYIIDISQYKLTLTCSNDNHLIPPPPEKYVMSEETKKKMSESKKGEKHHLFGKHLPDETKKKISQTLTGKPLEEGARQKLLEYYKTHEPASKGTVLSKEEREKISANKGVFMTFEKAKLIRAEKQNGIKSRDTCNRFNITLSTYYNIVHEKNWVE